LEHEYNSNFSKFKMLAAMSEQELHLLPNITYSQCTIEEYTIKFNTSVNIRNIGSYSNTGNELNSMGMKTKCIQIGKAQEIS
jgi:hypothetical protein